MKVDFVKDGWSYTTPIIAIANGDPKEQEIINTMAMCSHEYFDDGIAPCMIDEGTIALMQRCKKCGAVRGKFKEMENVENN